MPEEFKLWTWNPPEGASPVDPEALSLAAILNKELGIPPGKTPQYLIKPMV
jgi:hypothetical protein